MAQLNFTGNVGQEPELKYLESGKAVLNFSVADTLRRLNKTTNTWEDVSTTWWRVAVWEKAAETLAEHLHKGTRVVVEGTVHAREYEKDGDKRLSYDVTAKTVGLIPKSTDTQRTQQPATDAWSTPNTQEVPF